MSELQKREAYRYFAFVSYSSNDGAVAKKLQHQIETYRLPTVIRNELEAQRGQKFPPRLTPIFRDMTDLPPDVLGKSLLRELEDSKYLIVICSPHSALSTWVNLEIENFILMGRYEQIILYLIDGEPNSANPAREAFPPILRKNREYISYASYSEEENRERQAKLKKILAGQGELKAVSIAQEGAYVARMKTVARMLEVKPDDLIQRDKQRQQRQRFQNIGIVAAVLLLIFGFSLYAWDKYYRVHTNYYTDYVERWGVPEGIFELQKSQLQRRNSHYRIEKQAGRVVRLVHANSAGTPVPVGNTEFKDRPMIAEYQYQQDPDAETGRLLLTGVAHKNRNGKTLNWLKYSNDQRAIDFSHSAKDDSTGVKFLATRSTSISRDPFGITTKSETTRHLVQYDESGFTIRREFKKDNLNNPTQDAEGVAGFDYKLDEIGRVVELTYLDVKNQPCPTKIGVARRKYQYDDSGNLNSTEYLDVNGNPARNEHGWICREEVFDADGNVSQTCLHTHAITYSGQRLAKPSFADMVMGIKTAANAGSIKHKYDEQGNKTEEAYFDAYGEPCLGQGGFAIIRYKYDEQGNRTEDAFFGADDEPCLHNDGFAIVRCKYDERGNKTEQAYFEVYSKYHKPVLALSYEGLYAIVRCKYDERGNRVEEAYFGEDGEPCLRSGGYAILRCKCDERGNRIEESHFGVDGEPCLHNDCFAIVRVKYNERGNREETAYFGVDGKPCLNKDGCAIVRFKYDEQGNVTEFAHFGVDGAPCLRKDGISIFRCKIERGNRIEEAYFGVDGSPCLNKDGYAIVCMKHDNWGNTTEVACFGVDGKPCLSKEGVARRTFIHAAGWGRPIGFAHFGVDGKPCVDINGVSQVTNNYDERGNLAGQAHFGVDGKPCLDINGVARWTKKYNERGDLTEHAFFGVDGAPCLCNLGFAIIRLSLTERAFFGVDGKPCLNSDGYAIKRWKYNKQKGVVVTHYYDTEENELQQRDGDH